MEVGGLGSVEETVADLRNGAGLPGRSGVSAANVAKAWKVGDGGLAQQWGLEV
jgi:hypothetical protein